MSLRCAVSFRRETTGAEMTDKLTRVDCLGGEGGDVIGKKYKCFLDDSREVWG